MKRKIRYSDIAAELGVSRQLVHQVKKGIIPANDGKAKIVKAIIELLDKKNESKKCG